MVERCKVEEVVRVFLQPRHAVVLQRAEGDRVRGDDVADQHEGDLQVGEPVLLPPRTRADSAVPSSARIQTFSSASLRI